MKFTTSALLVALSGLAAMQVQAPIVRAEANRGYGNKYASRSRRPGKPQPAGSKLAKQALKGHVGIW